MKLKIQEEKRIIDEKDFSINPSKVEWGTAPVLVQATNKSGKIKVKAKLVFEGINKAVEGEIEFESINNATRMIFSEKPDKEVFKKSEFTLKNSDEIKPLKEKLRRIEIELRDIQLKQVEKQQSEIENKLLKN